MIVEYRDGGYLLVSQGVPVASICGAYYSDNGRAAAKLLCDDFNAREAALDLLTAAKAVLAAYRDFDCNGPAGMAEPIEDLTLAVRKATGA